MSEPAKSLTLPPKAFQRSEYVAVQFTAVIPEGHTVEDVLRPSYWAHVASKISRNSEIHAIADDYSWGARLLVVFADGKSINVISTGKWQGEGVDNEVKSADLKIINSASGFRIVERSTGKVLAEGIPTRKLAAEKMAELETKRAA